MAGSSNISGDESIIFADNASFDGTERGGKMTTNGQLWIGSTTSPHVRLGTLSAGTGISITNSAGGISIASNVSAGIPTIGSSTDKSIVTWNGTNGDAVQNNANLITTAAGAIKLSNGSASLPSFSFSSLSNGGMYTDGSNLRWAIDGVAYLALLSGGELSVSGFLNVANSTTLNGAQIVTSVSSAVSYVVLTSNFQIVITDTSVARTVTLPASPTQYQQFRIKDGSFAAGTNNITVSVSGGVKTIDGAATAVINTNGGKLTVMYDGTNYLIVG